MLVGEGERRRTEGDGVDFAVDLDHRGLDVEDVDDLVDLGRVDADVEVVLVVLLLVRRRQPAPLTGRRWEDADRKSVV